MDDYMRLEHDRDHRESSRHPRGNRLTIQPINAPGIGRDEPSDETTEATTKEKTT